MSRLIVDRLSITSIGSALSKRLRCGTRPWELKRSTTRKASRTQCSTPTDLMPPMPKSDEEDVFEHVRHAAQFDVRHELI